MKYNFKMFRLSRTYKHPKLVLTYHQLKILYHAEPIVQVNLTTLAFFIYLHSCFITLLS